MLDTPRSVLRLLCHIQGKGRMDEAVRSGEDADDQGRWMVQCCAANGAWSGKLKNPGKRFFLELAAEAVRKINEMRDAAGISYARKEWFVVAFFSTSRDVGTRSSFPPSYNRYSLSTGDSLKLRPSWTLCRARPDLWRQYRAAVNVIHLAHRIDSK